MRNNLAYCLSDRLRHSESCQHITFVWQNIEQTKKKWGKWKKSNIFIVFQLKLSSFLSLTCYFYSYCMSQIFSFEWGGTVPKKKKKINDCWAKKILDATLIIFSYYSRPTYVHSSLAWMFCQEHQLMGRILHITTIISFIITISIIIRIKLNRCRSYRMKSAPSLNFATWLLKPFQISNTRWHRREQAVQLQVFSHRR